MHELGNEKFRDIIAEDINNHIDQGYDVIIYQACSGIAVISEGTNVPAIIAHARLNYEKNESITINDL